MTNSTGDPFSPPPSMYAISASTPPTYIIATAIIVSVLLIFVLVGFWIYFSTCKDIAPAHPSQSRYTTRPVSTTSPKTLPGWFRNIARSSPTLPLFKQNENDLALLREVLWSHPEDDYKPAKRRSAPNFQKQRPLTSHPVLLDKSPAKMTCSPVSPVNAYTLSSNTKPSLLARRHIRASKQPLALALPAITERSHEKKKLKGKKTKPIKTPLAVLSKAHLKISSPKLQKSVAERLAQHYHLISPLRQQARVNGTTISASTNPVANPVYFQSKHLTEAATASTSSIVLSPTIAHRRMLTSGPTEGDVIADLKSPYIYTPDFARTPVSSTRSSPAEGRVYTPYRPGFGGNEGMGGIDSVVVHGKANVLSNGGGRGEGLLSTKLPHPGARWTGSL